jgi:hypothetical protein
MALVFYFLGFAAFLGEFRHAVPPSMIAIFVGPALIPILGAALYVAFLSHTASPSGIMIVGTLVWVAYFLVLVIWIVGMTDSLSQAYASIMFLPWMCSWLLVSFGAALAYARQRP